jgi:hypothetical protein
MHTQLQLCVPFHIEHPFSTPISLVEGDLLGFWIIIDSDFETQPMLGIKCGMILQEDGKSMLISKDLYL